MPGREWWSALIVTGLLAGRPRGIVGVAKGANRAVDAASQRRDGVQRQSAEWIVTVSVRCAVLVGLGQRFAEVVVSVADVVVEDVLASPVVASGYSTFWIRSLEKIVLPVLVPTP